LVSSSGIYHIKVYGDNTGNLYDLIWETEEDQSGGGIPGYDLLFLFCTILGILSIMVIKWKKTKL
jgi:hypothetical protein